MRSRLLLPSLRASVPPWFIFLLLFALVGCERAQPSASHSAGELRIVSLSPAISRTLVDFGLEEHIVGRTPFCASIDQSIPVVGSLLDLDYERLIKLEPTHVLVQPSLAQGVDPKLRSLAETHGWMLGEFPGLNTIDDVEHMILALPAVLYGDDAAALQSAASRAAELTTQIASALKPAGDSAFKGSVLLVAGVEPVFVYGDDTYLDDILAALGGTNAAHATGWAELSLEDVVRLDPEAIVLVRERPVNDGDVERALGPLAALPIRAVKDGRLAALVHPDAELPSSGVIGVAGALRDVLVDLARKEAGE